MNEPKTPDFGVQDPPEVEDQNQQDTQPVQNNENEGADEEPQNDFSPPNAIKKQQEEEAPEGQQQQTEQNIDSIVEGWQEDRKLLDKLKKENQELQKQYSKEEIDFDSEEFEGLSDKEKFDKAYEKRKELEQRQQELEQAEVESEARFMSVKYPEQFAKNKEAIIKYAGDKSMNSLEQAMWAWIGEQKAQQKFDADQKYLDKQKKNAGGTTGGSGKSGTGVGKYDPKTDKDKSIADLYREGGF